ncbi:MAG TPA: hypothetical protein VFD25_01830 [Clostridia bacterium]|nr:hypothetical protein [Clostridia bacterium]
MKKIIAFLSLTLMLFSSGCFAERCGNDLSSLLSRVNERYEKAVISAEGFHFDEDKNSQYGYICYGDDELLVYVDLDEKNRITACHLVFDSINAPKDESVRSFIFVLLSCYTGDSKENINTALENLSVFTNEKALLSENTFKSEKAEYTYTATNIGALLSCSLISVYETVQKSSA